MCVSPRFEDLRIRREKRPPRGTESAKKQTQKQLAKLENHDDKKACLLFTATVKIGNGSDTVTLQTISLPISLSKLH